MLDKKYVWLITVIVAVFLFNTSVTKKEAEFNNGFYNTMPHAQSFVTTGYDINSIDVRLDNSNDVRDDIQMEIRERSVTGTLLSTSTMSYPYGDRFTFPSVETQESTTYFFILKNPSSDSIFEVSDDADPYPNGNRWRKLSGIWRSEPNWDIVYSINGDLPLQCSNDCLSESVRCIAEIGFQTCGNYDEDACLEWSEGGRPCSCDVDEDCGDNQECLYSPLRTTNICCPLDHPDCELSECESDADLNCDGCTNREELIRHAQVWLAHDITRIELISVANNWLNRDKNVC